MATIPNGTPAWTRSADHTFYGGHVDKANYQDEPIVNPKTDVGANAIQRMAADLAAVARMANFATVTFTANESGSSISVTACRLMTGAISASYAGTSPPVGFPTVTHVSAKVYSVAIGGVYSDPYSVDAVFAPAFAGSTCTSGVYTSKAYVSGTATVMIESGTGTGTHTVWIA
jgi:hypothetical protein